MSFRLIPPLEKSERLVAWCQQPLGRCALLACFTLVLIPFGQGWPLIAGLLVLTTTFPSYRRAIVSACGLAIAVAIPNWLDVSFLNRLAAEEKLPHFSRVALGSVVFAVFLLLAFAAAAIYRYPRSWLARRPVFAAIFGFGVLVAVLSAAPLAGWYRVIAWAAILAAAQMFWFFCYTLSDRASAAGYTVPLQAGFWRPAWMVGSSSSTPFVKGAAYLRKIEPRNSQELAITQLKGLKLLLWALLLKFGQDGFQRILATWNVPDLQAAFASSVSGHPLAWRWNCLAVIASFFASLLVMSVGGHQIVACARMAGFRAMRNTYRPLESRSLADFWNRYYFYFKDLMVDMFFFPTYLRYFKKHPRLRMVAATMMAAFVGNAFYHFLREISVIGELGWRRATFGFQTYLFYSLVLGAAISLSQLRGKRKDDPAQPWWRRRLIPIACVSGFFCALHIFDDTGRTIGLREHFVFVGRLIGI